MANSLDLTAVWNDTMALLGQHKEAAIAIAGVFLFLPSWLLKQFMVLPEMVGTEKPDQIMEIMLEFLNDNWMLLLASLVLTTIGGLAYYIILTRQKSGTISNALKRAVGLFPLYIIVILSHFIILFCTFLIIFTPVSIALSFITAGNGIAFFAALIAMAYLIGRFVPLQAVLAAESERGFTGLFKRTWGLTHNVGWMICLMIFIVSLIAIIIMVVFSLVFALVLSFLGDSIGVLLNNGVSALLQSVYVIITATLHAAIYRHLKPQVDGAVTSASE